MYDQYNLVVGFKYPTHEGEGVSNVFGDRIMTGIIMCQYSNSMLKHARTTLQHGF